MCDSFVEGEGGKAVRYFSARRRTSFLLHVEIVWQRALFCPSVCFRLLKSAAAAKPSSRLLFLPPKTFVITAVR